VDLTFARGKLGVQILPASFGVAAEPGTVGYGCTISSGPRKAIVISI
jgi:hypothetical protein